ncbi:MAG: prefoldin subunit [Candidatus Pacearchaeota archaeon]
MNFEDFYANLDEETKKRFQELQIYEQTFEQILEQEKLIDLEVDEINYTINEIEKAEGEIFKLVGHYAVIKTEKNKFIEELNHKKELLTLNKKNLEKQRKVYEERIEEIKKRIIDKVSKK